MTFLAFRTRLAPQGDSSTGLPLSPEVLEAAGLPRDAEVMVEATGGRIVITPVCSGLAMEHAKAMESFEKSLGRYGNTYAALAK